LFPANKSGIDNNQWFNKGLCMPTLEEAIELSLSVHRGQTDKAGKPYILHPLRVMLQMTTEIEQITAVLHDALEDSSLTINDLKSKGYSDDILSALKCLTRRSDKSYDVYIDRVKTNPLSIRVKLADLKDNLNLSRITNPTSKDHARQAKYQKALTILEQALAVFE
jgi:(p)ppGpp synthase/HD superfamily hydrolase